MLTYDGMEPVVAQGRRRSRRKQTGESLKQLHDFAADLRDREAAGKKFTRRGGGHARGRGRRTRRRRSPARSRRRRPSSTSRSWRARPGCACAERQSSRLLAAIALLGIAAPACAAPVWRDGGPIQSELFTAQSELLLGGPGSTIDRVDRARRLYRGQLARRMRADAPAVDRGVRRALRDARTAALRRDEAGLAAARGAAARGPARRRLRGDDRRRDPARRADGGGAGCCCASSAAPPASPARASTPPTRSRAWRAARARRGRPRSR